MLIWTKVLKWLLIGVAVGLLPVGLKAAFTYVGGQPITSQSLLGDGELFLVGAGLAAAGIGDLVFQYRAPNAPQTPQGLTLIRASAGTLAGLSALVGTAIYGLGSDNPVATTEYINASILMVIVTAVAGFRCVLLAKEEAEMEWVPALAGSLLVRRPRNRHLSAAFAYLRKRSSRANASPPRQPTAHNVRSQNRTGSRQEDPQVSLDCRQQ